MQNPLHKFTQSSITSQKPGYFSGKLNILMGSNFNILIFSADILHTFPT